MPIISSLESLSVVRSDELAIAKDRHPAVMTPSHQGGVRCDRADSEARSRMITKRSSLSLSVRRRRLIEDEDFRCGYSFGDFNHLLLPTVRSRTLVVGLMSMLRCLRSSLCVGFALFHPTQNFLLADSRPMNMFYDRRCSIIFNSW